MAAAATALYENLLTSTCSTARSISWPQITNSSDEYWGNTNVYPLSAFAPTSLSPSNLEYGLVA